MKVVLATANEGKIGELSHLLRYFSIEVVSQSQLGVKPIEETGLTFVENAILKARHASELTGLPAIADDSGLIVPALSGEPGILSARFAGKQASDQDNIKKLLNKLKNVPHEKRMAHFLCIVVFMLHAKDPAPLIAEGRWTGEIVSEPKGEGGFGYDPVFYLHDKKQTAAELPLAVKNSSSHRGLALHALIKKLPEKI